MKPGFTISAGEAEVIQNLEILKAGPTRADLEAEFGKDKVVGTGEVTARGEKWTMALTDRKDALKLADMRRRQRTLIAERGAAARATWSQEGVTVTGANGKRARIHPSNERDFARGGVIRGAVSGRRSLIYREGKWWRRVGSEWVEDVRGRIGGGDGVGG